MLMMEKLSVFHFLYLRKRQNQVIIIIIHMYIEWNSRYWSQYYLLLTILLTVENIAAHFSPAASDTLRTPNF